MRDDNHAEAPIGISRMHDVNCAQYRRRSLGRRTAMWVQSQKLARVRRFARAGVAFDFTDISPR
jgi:hypothetical protein